jgi:hypothetical protein
MHGHAGHGSSSNRSIARLPVSVAIRAARAGMERHTHNRPPQRAAGARSSTPASRASTIGVEPQAAALLGAPGCRQSAGGADTGADDKATHAQFGSLQRDGATLRERPIHKCENGWRPFGCPSSKDRQLTAHYHRNAQVSASRKPTTPYPAPLRWLSMKEAAVDVCDAHQSYRRTIRQSHGHIAVMFLRGRDNMLNRVRIFTNEGYVVVVPEAEHCVVTT